MLWLSACHFVSHLVQQAPMTTLILLGFLFHVISPGSVPILQQRFKSLFTHFQTTIHFMDLSLPPVLFIVDCFSSLFSHTQVRFICIGITQFSVLKCLYPKKRENLEETGILFVIVEVEHSRRCEKLKTIQWGQKWCCLAFETETVSAEPI